MIFQLGMVIQQLPDDDLIVELEGKSEGFTEEDFGLLPRQSARDIDDFLQKRIGSTIEQPTASQPDIQHSRFGRSGVGEQLSHESAIIGIRGSERRREE